MHFLGNLESLQLKAQNQTTRILPSSQQIFQVDFFWKYTKDFYLDIKYHWFSQEQVKICNSIANQIQI